MLILLSGSLFEQVGDLDGAIQGFEQALRHNQWSLPAMNGIAGVLKAREQYPKAVEYFQNILKIDSTDGKIWGSLGEFLDTLTQALHF